MGEATNFPPRNQRPKSPRQRKPRSQRLRRLPKSQLLRRQRSPRLPRSLQQRRLRSLRPRRRPRSNQKIVFIFISTFTLCPALNWVSFPHLHVTFSSTYIYTVRFLFNKCYNSKKK